MVVIHEVLQELQSTKKEGVIPKLDLEKAYDKINWNFLKEVLEKKGFMRNLLIGL